MKTILVIYLVLTATATAVLANHAIDESENPQYLFVLSAESGTYEDGKLTLKSVPAVLYFSDRPNRIAGHISLEEFVKIWGEGIDSFKADPPNATLSILEEDGNTDIIVELMNPLLIENGVTFDITILDGKIPVSFGSSALFIDRCNTTVNTQITD
ncbi:MAG: hypothetical protein GY771_03255 [bacterium]|nr:hypothetical protein [bacterium]